MSVSCEHLCFSYHNIFHIGIQYANLTILEPKRACFFSILPCPTFISSRRRTNSPQTNDKEKQEKANKHCKRNFLVPIRWPFYPKHVFFLHQFCLRHSLFFPQFAGTKASFVDIDIFYIIS